MTDLASPEVLAKFNRMRDAGTRKHVIKARLSLDDAQFECLCRKRWYDRCYRAGGALSYEIPEKLIRMSDRDCRAAIEASGGTFRDSLRARKANLGGPQPVHYQRQSGASSLVTVYGGARADGRRRQGG